MKTKLSVIILVCFMLMSIMSINIGAQEFETEEIEVFSETEEEIFEEELFVLDVQEPMYALSGAPAEIDSTVYNIDHTDFIIRGIAKDTTVEAFLGNIEGAENGIIKRGTSELGYSDTLKTGDKLTVSGSDPYTIKTDLIEDYYYFNENYDPVGTTAASKGSWSSNAAAVSTASETVNGVTRNYIEVNMATGTKIVKSITSRTTDLYVTEYDIWLPPAAQYPLSSDFRMTTMNSASKFLATFRRNANEQKALILSSAGTWSKAGTGNLPLGEWATVRIVTDNKARTFTTTVNGVLKFQHPNQNTYALPYQVTDTNIKPTKFEFDWRAAKASGIIMKLDNFKMYEPGTVAVSKATFITGEDVSIDVNNVYNKVNQIKLNFVAADGVGFNETTLSNIKLYNSSNAEITTSNGGYDAVNKVYTLNVEEDLVAGQRYTIKFAGVTDSKYGISMTETVGFDTVSTPAPTYSITSDEYTVDDTNLEITGITPGVTKAQLMANLTITGATPVVKDADGNDVAENDVIKDETTITLKDSLNTSKYVVKLDFTTDLISVSKVEYIAGTDVSEDALNVKHLISNIKIYFTVSDLVSLDTTSLSGVKVLKPNGTDTVQTSDGGYDVVNKVYTLDIDEGLTVGETYTLKIENVKDTVFEKAYTITRSFTAVQTPPPVYTISSNKYNIDEDALTIKGVESGTTKAEFISTITVSGVAIVGIEDKDGNEISDSDVVENGYKLILADSIQKVIYTIETVVLDDNYLVNETYDSAVGSWTSTTGLSLAEDGGRKYLQVDMSKVASLTKNIPNNTADVIVTEYDLFLPSATDYPGKFDTSIKNASSKFMPVIRRNTGKTPDVFRCLVDPSWSTESSLTLGDWINIKIVMYNPTRKFTVYVDETALWSNLTYQAEANSVAKTFLLEWTKQSTAKYIGIDNFKVYAPNPLVASKVSFVTGTSESFGVNDVENLVDEIKIQFTTSERARVDSASLTDIKLYDSNETVVETEGSYSDSTEVYTLKVNEVLKQNEAYTIKINGVKDTQYAKAYSKSFSFTSKDADVKVTDATVTPGTTNVTVIPEITNMTSASLDVDLIAAACDSNGKILAVKAYKGTVSHTTPATPTVVITTGDKTSDVATVKLYLKGRNSAPLSVTYEVAN